MSALVDTPRSVVYKDGFVIVSMQSGVEVRFPTGKNPRLSGGTREQLEHIEISPFGIHWPDLDEDLSFRGLLAGDFGQNLKGGSGATPNGNAGDTRAP